MEHDDIDLRLAARLRALRADRGWSLAELAERSGLSRATLSRLENAEVSATAQGLGRLAAAHGMTASRLMQEAEADFRPLIRAEDQPEWVDPETGFRRRQLSPPAGALQGEALACALPPGARLVYPAPPRPGLEHHLALLSGALEVRLGETLHALRPGDCLRYALHGPSAFQTGAEGARYHLFLV